MLLRRLVPLAAAAALALPALSGCGAEDAAGVGIADAAGATAKKGTANYTFRLSMSGLGLPNKVDLKAAGVTSLSKPQMTMRMDLASLLASFGAPIPGAVIDLKLDGRDIYVKPPEIPGLPIPGGKEWISLDIVEIAEAFGVDAEGLAPLFAYDPSAYLRLVNSAKGMKEVGTETVNGTETRHFRGTYTGEDLINGLPADRQAAARDALEKFETQFGDDLLAAPTPVDIWIDDEGVARRMSSAAPIPAAKGQAAGKMSFVYDLTKFGAKLDVSKPASVTDVTDDLVTLFKSDEFRNALP